MIAHHEIQLFRFGMTPSWMTKPALFINARAEGDHNPDNNPAYTGTKGIITKPAFRSPSGVNVAWFLPMPLSKDPKKRSWTNLMWFTFGIKLGHLPLQGSGTAGKIR